MRADVQWLRAQIAGAPQTAVVLGVVGYLVSLTPSLLPRPWFFQGLVGGISAAMFFGVGVLIDDAWRGFVQCTELRVELNQRARRALRIIWRLVVALTVLLAPVLSLGWQAQVARYVGVPEPGWTYPLLSLVVAAGAFLLPVVLWHLITELTRWLTGRFLRRHVQDRVARAAAVLVTAVAVLAVGDQVVWRGLVLAAQHRATVVNATVPEGTSPPTSALRSGGPGSLVTWDSLGSDGQTFVSSGPDAADITRTTGVPSKEPIRVFVGTDQSRPLDQAVDLVVAEMDRTGAFERSAVVVVTATSTGFVNEWATEALEYLRHGDTAVVTLQYSTLPSAFALLTAGEEPPLVARQLFDAVAARVAVIPAAQRPRLYAMGESLGAYGGNGAFDSPQDMLDRVDGALWTGTPSFTPMHAELTAARNPGSSMVDPVIDNGRNVRFGGDPSQLVTDEFGRPLGEWLAPRVVYLQHNTDPVVWWSPQLLLGSPGWLEETRPEGSPMALMSWLPVVTFWQVTADLAMANTVPAGFGHRYQELETVPAWAGILGLDPAGDYTAIEGAIAAANAQLAETES